eukprot:TRINITY_DN24779_c0_g1_i1.p1 TRINITY_DN24779_c0_g1~~TRINITY_DN24779_c0_g1_i1.p1  ORF type:complete len:299 (+),score=30.43 TRINITY_DN24779_c0_g1_i1:50-946(+)
MATRKLRAQKCVTEEVADKLDKIGWKTCGDYTTGGNEEAARALGLTLTEELRLRDKLMNEIMPKIEPILKKRRKAVIRTTIASLDKALKGGISEGMITEIAGPPGVGKSQFATMMAVNCTMSDNKGKVLFIDTERKFSSERAKEILLSHNGAVEDLRLINVKPVGSLEDLLELLKEIELQAFESEARLIVIDSIAALIRAKSSMSPADRSGLVSGIASTLKKLAFNFSLCILLTNHVTHHNKAALGNTWHHAVTTRLMLLPSTPRCLIIDKCPAAPNLTIPFSIGPAGIVECPQIPLM